MPAKKARRTVAKSRGAAKSKQGKPKADMFRADVATAPCVPKIRLEVSDWVKYGYKGATATTKALLNHWFYNDHILANGQRFAYFPFQKEAVETLIYLYEVSKKRSSKDLLEAYATEKNLRLLQYDLFPRYCLKLATGTGKTKIISLAVAWQYFNSILEDANNYASTSLVIAPNVIVFERLKGDFEGGRIFTYDPIIPPSLKVYWDYQCYMRGDSERSSSQGALYLENIQQLYERKEKNDDETSPIAAVLGPKPKNEISEIEPFAGRILKRGGRLFVANDEAHHTHDEENEWSRAIRRLHEGLEERKSKGVIQLDMSATPRYGKSGSLFTWTVFDYPLKQAILDRVVKRPLKGIAKGFKERPSEITSEKYQVYLTAGVKRWQEYRDKLQPLNRKPVLFIMMNSTKEADDVADYLRNKYPSEFAERRLQIIHTDNTGEVSKKDVEEARVVAKEIDDPSSPVNCIVSVLMLREGWDVQSVTVVVGLRPYTSKANILPEQTIGRGLRLMFRSANIGEESVFQENLDVIGNTAFIQFVEDLEKIEGMEFETIDLDKQPVTIETIFPDPEKADKDILLPVISPILTRKKTLSEEIAAIDVSKIKIPKLPKKQNDEAAKHFHYEGYDIITLEKLVEREYKIPEVGTSQEVISYYAKRIAASLKLPSQFAPLVPKIREFLQDYAFGETVDLDTPVMIRAISHPVAQHVTLKAFVQILRETIVEEHQPVLENHGKAISSCEPFPWSRQTVNATKTMFNLCPASNNFEVGFTKFLEGADDVIRFAKLPEDRFDFSISYVDSKANLRYYYPDFVAITTDGVHHLIETKGREDVDVQHKDRAALVWCENASMLTDNEWKYQKVMQKEFEQLRPDDFEDLIGLEDIEML
jgi:type III restriction enzyme